MNNSRGAGYQHMLKQDLHECDAAFVVGYSMADPDFATTFFNSDDLVNKCFVFSGIADELSAYRISLIGTDTKLGVSDIARLAKERLPEAATTFRSEIIVNTSGYNTKHVTQSA